MNNLAGNLGTFEHEFTLDTDARLYTLVGVLFVLFVVVPFLLKKL